jgi:hypothetical protein
MHNDDGPFVLRPMSEFNIIRAVLDGQQDDVRRRLRRGRRGLRNAARVFTRCINLFPLTGSESGFWNAVDEAIKICNEEGYYFSPVLILDVRRQRSDGSFEDILSRDQIREWIKEWLRRYKNHTGFFWSLVNEPEQPWQGFSGPTDPFIIEMAELMARELGHRDFVIGAAADGDNPDASKETLDLCVQVSHHCNFPAIHSSRKGGAAPSEERWRRHIDHLEGFVEIVIACRKVNPDVIGYHEESMGHASQQFVPLPNGRRYEREYDPEAAVAAAVTAETIGTIYCYHYINTQDDGTPGLEEMGQVLASYPAGWKYLNDSWDGAPSRGFTDDAGKSVEGKVRHYVNGPDARTLAYTKDGVPRVKWANGFNPTGDLYRGNRVAVIAVHQ